MAYYTPLIVLVWLALLVLCILVKENARFTKEKKMILYFTCLVIAFAALAEWLGIKLDGNASASHWPLRAVKFFDYVLTPIAGGAIVLQFETKNVWRKILFLIIGANTLYQFVSLFTGWMITIDADNHYSHGPGYTVYIVFYLAIILLVVVEFVIYGKQFRRQNLVSLYSTILFTAVGISLQELMGGEVRTAYVSLALGLSFLFIHNSEFAQLASDDRIQEQMVRISEDPLTGLSNRYAYNEAMEELSLMPALPEDHVVFSIDVNGLKNTNDTRGHHAGDELIRGAAECIFAVFSPYGKCFRTGGDEFIVFAAVKKEFIPDLTARLEESCNAWQGKEAPALSLSVGYAVASDKPGVSAEKLVALADREMYQAKSEYYQSTGLERRKV